MNSSHLRVILVVAFATIASLYLGVAAATNQLEAIFWVVGTVAVVGVFALGRNVWLLIPFGLVLEGTVNALPGSPPVWALGTLTTIAIFSIRFAMRRPDFKFKFDLLDFAVLLQVIAISQAYFRNPSGLLIFGGETAGSKPYLNFAVAVVAYFCLAAVKADLKVFKAAVIVMVCAMIFDGLLVVTSDYVPLLASAVLPIYSNTSVGAALSGQAASYDTSTSRLAGGLGDLGRSLGKICLTMARPLHCVLPTHPLLFITFGGAVAAILLSGFRSTLVYLFVIYVTSALLRRKPVDIVVVVFVGFTGLSALIASGQIKNLPFGAQRALSFLPVEVDPAAKADAEESSNWRFEMWKIALTSDKYIRNKALGDGFAISARELQAQRDAALGFSSGVVIDNKEAFLLRGSYHGFHVETIRFTGVLGLGCAVFAMVVFSRKALHLARYYRGQACFPYVAFVCIPVIIYPFWVLLVFGSYRSGFPEFIASAGMLKMLDSLRESKSVPSGEGS